MVTVTPWIGAFTICTTRRITSTGTWWAPAGFVVAVGVITTSTTVTSHAGTFGSTRITRINRLFAAPAITARSTVSTFRTLSSSASGSRALAISARATVTLSTVRTYFTGTSGLVTTGTVFADGALSALLTFYSWASSGATRSGSVAAAAVAAY